MTGTVSTGGVAESSPTSPLGAGTYSFLATYAGDGNYLPATGSCQAFTVAPANPALTSTSVENASTNQPWTQPQPLGSTATASTTVTGLAGFPPAATSPSPSTPAARATPPALRH